MAKSYFHVTLDQRCLMQSLLSMGKTQRMIAEEVGVNQSTISREIARNSGDSDYIFKTADDKSVLRRSAD